VNGHRSRPRPDRNRRDTWAVASGTVTFTFSNDEGTVDQSSVEAS